MSTGLRSKHQGSSIEEWRWPLWFFPPGSLPASHSEHERKIPHTSYRRGGKVTILKCFWTFWSFYKKSPSNILFYNILPTLTREIIPSLSFWSHLQGKKLLGSTYEVTASELVLTNNLRSNHRIIVCSLSLPPYLSTTQNRLLYNNGLQLNGLRLQGSDPM